MRTEGGRPPWRPPSMRVADSKRGNPWNVRSDCSGAQLALSWEVPKAGPAPGGDMPRLSTARRCRATTPHVSANQPGTRRWRRPGVRVGPNTWVSIGWRDSAPTLAFEKKLLVRAMGTNAMSLRQKSAAWARYLPSRLMALAPMTIAVGTAICRGIQPSFSRRPSIALLYPSTWSRHRTGTRRCASGQK